MNALRLLALRLGRHTAAYGSNGVIALAFGVVNIAVLTRFLSLEEFGELALLLLFAAALTILYNLGVLQGGFSWVFGAGDEGADDDQEAGAGNKRRALGTALALVVVVAIAGTLLVAAGRGLLATVLVGHEERSGEVLLAGISGALGSIWRLVSNVPRFERRPGRFIALAVTRPTLVLALSVALVAGGHGVEGALIGVAGGTLAAIAVALVTTRRNYEFAFERSDVRPIVKRGRVYVPLLLSFWVVQNVDLYLVSLFGSDGDVARYRVASRLGAGMSYFASAFLLAWTPLMRSGLGEAVKRERGAAAVAAIATYFIVACAWVTLALALLADLLIRVAPENYSEAAPLIPLVALGFVAYGAFVVIYRGADFPRKRAWYVGLALLAVLIFVALGPVLVSWFGAYGAALAQLLAFTVSTAILLGRSQRGPRPIPFEYGKITVAVGLAALLVLAGRLVDDALGAEASVVFALLALAAYPIAVVLLGVVPREQVSVLAGAAGLSRRRERPGSSPWVLDGLRELGPEDRGVLALAARPDTNPGELAAALAVTEEAALERTVAALRTLGGFGRRGSLDARMGRHLLSTAPVAQRDAQARKLWSEGVDPFELEALELLLSRLRRLPDRGWKATDRPAKRVGPIGAKRRPLVQLKPRPGAERLAVELESDRVRLSDEDSPGFLPGEFVFHREAELPYILQEASREDAPLVVCFSSYRWPSGAPSFAYFGTLGEVDCQRLFLRATAPYNRQSRDFLGSSPVEQVVERAMERFKLGRDQVIACGAGMGGSAAIDFGLTVGVRHLVVGAPPVLYGEYLLGQTDAPGIRGVAPRRAARRTERDERAHLNDVTLRKVRDAEHETTLHLLCRGGDKPDPHVQAIAQACRENERVDLRVTRSDYARQRELDDVFGAYMIATIEQVIGPDGGARRRQAAPARA